MTIVPQHILRKTGYLHHESKVKGTRKTFKKTEENTRLAFLKYTSLHLGNIENLLQLAVSRKRRKKSEKRAAKDEQSPNAKKIINIKVSSHTLIDCMNYFRDVCAEHFTRHPQMTKGSGQVAELEEMPLTRRKYDGGRIVQKQWCFGVSERSISALPLQSNGEMLQPFFH